MDPHFELLAALARAAGFDEYLQGGVPAWNAAVDAHFAKLKHHPAVNRLRRARAEGASYDAFPSLALHLTGEVGAPALLAPLEPWPPELDRRWKAVDLAAWLKEIASAARKADFAALWEAQSELRTGSAAAAAEARAAFDLPWFERWFGFPAPELHVYGALGAGPHNYGVRRGGGRPAIAAYLGVTQGEPGITIEGAAELLPHEVGHSFVNPLMAEHRDVLQGPAERLHGAVRERMEARAYTTWETVLNESVLRAVVVRYLRDHGGETAARMEVAAQMEAGFPWTPVLVDAFAAYDADRARFPTFGDYAVELAAVLSVIAEEESERAKSRPHVVSITPANGDLSVSPATATIVVTFDRAMRDKSWSIVGGEQVPPGDNPGYDASLRVFTLHVRLDPGRSYALSLNGGRFRGFQSAEGVPLEPVAVAFSTAPR
ncbi:hypothetical protein LBMAG42_42000 [Deltaproteobacteria bacterium]|nr:hypothetical protein LBMAG42_42000 [Deltaproteobacteria bacterium]